ncbi:hypothetical protein NQT62_02050 [Limnobacter humi]|uniref:Uncharacterized protein n=1 Tax=Limnobacter humi TaxID=1778671 RepID=A0ABT1WCH5_9BURK|nr:hypothetical protein [Limnobacter humi]MCQ8895219.1 hypothetical protein [Limnobacter humi]
MSPLTKQRLFWLLSPPLIGLLVPSLVIFCLQVWVGHIPPSAALADILARQFAAGENLFYLALIGLIPCVLLSVLCFAMAGSLHSNRLWCVGLGGLSGIVAVMVAMHVSVWYPLYGPGRMSSTAVVALVFMPVTGCIGMVVGGLLGWWLSWKR